MNEAMEHDETMRITHKRRLNYLEVQAAQLGMGAPAEIFIEIDDIRTKIAEIEIRLQKPQKQRNSAQAELAQLER
jgi:hypothetical protein